MLTEIQKEFVKLMEDPNMLIDEDYLITSLQDLIDSGSIWNLPNHYLIAAGDFIADGTCYPREPRKGVM